MARSVLLLTLSVLACGFVSCCGPAPPAAQPARPSAPARPAAASGQAEAAREQYILHALHESRPPRGLTGHREIALGTGFYISRSEVLTNFHVVGNCGGLTVGNGVEGREMTAHLVAGDQAADLAVIATAPAPGVAPARFETALYTETGAHLAVVGYPAHGLAVLKAELRPITARQVDLVATRPRYVFDGVIHPGNSGSPVLDDSGAVVGVVTAEVDTPKMYRETGHLIENIGIAIANRTVFRFLSRRHLRYRPAIPAPGLDRAALLAKARGFVRQIGCWR